MNRRVLALCMPVAVAGPVPVATHLPGDSANSRESETAP